MKKLYKIINNKLLSKTKEIRKDRGAKFMFFPKEISSSNLIEILKNELRGDYDKSDNILIGLLLKDLTHKKIIKEKSVIYDFYNLDTLTYHDIHITTIDNKIYCRGTSVDRSEAFAKAFGEVFERTAIRFATNNERMGKIVEKNFEESQKDKNFFNLNLYPQATEKQKDLFNLRLKRDDIFTWIKCENFIDNQEKYIPIQSIIFGEPIKHVEKILEERNTNGCGAGYTMAEAIKSSVFEIVNRHFYLNSWFQKKTPKQININTITKNTLIYKKIEELQKRDFTIHILDYTEEAKLPSSIVILEKEGGWHMGGGAGFTLEYSINKALDEAFATYIWSCKRLLDGSMHINEELINNIDEGFIDKKANANNKIKIFTNSYYVENFKKRNNNFLLSGIKINYVEISEKYNIKNINNDTEKINFFKNYLLNTFDENVFIYKKEAEYLKEFNFEVVHLFVPNSYAFSLDDTKIRPIIQNKKEPLFTEINPFP